MRRRNVAHDDTAGPGGRFSLLQPVAANAFASLWEGEDSASGDAVLIEVVRGAPPAEPGDAQVLRERMAAALRAPSHPGLLAVREIYTPSPEAAAREDGQGNWGRWLLVLEPFDGSTLYQRAVFGGLTSEAICAIAAKVGEAIGALHDVGIAHGSLAATSVLVSDRGDVRVIDAIVGSWLNDLAGGRGRGERDVRRDDLAALARLVTERVPPDDVPASMRWLLASRDEPTLDELVRAFRGAAAPASSPGDVDEPEPLAEPTRTAAADDATSLLRTTSSVDEVQDPRVFEEERIDLGETVRRDEPRRSAEREGRREPRATRSATTSLHDDAVEEEDPPVVVFVPDAVGDDEHDEGSPSPPPDERGADQDRAAFAAPDEDPWFTLPDAPSWDEADRRLALLEPSALAPSDPLPARPSVTATPSGSSRASADGGVPETEPAWWMTAIAVFASLVMFGAIGAGIYYLLLNP